MANDPASPDQAAPGRRTYRAFYLNHSGAVQRAEILDAQTDEEAKAAAARLCNGHGIILWERARFLASYPPLAVKSDDP